MSIIVDANCAHRLSFEDDDGSLVLEVLISGKIDFVTGGAHKREILRTKLGDMLHDLRMAGRLREFDDDSVLEEAKEVSTVLLSNDEHIIGLARISGCRLLYSYDEELGKDFKNPKIIDKPRGKIYKYSFHRRLLESACR